MDSREVLVVCSDKSLNVGITIWNMDTGDQLLHIPTCASSPRGLTCLRKQYIVASQIHKHGSLGGGSIFIWPLNKPQAPLRCYPIEAIGPMSSTTDGVYLAGGAYSGNIYIWEVSEGRLLKNWHAHQKSLTSLVFSKDDSLLISGSEDGMIIVWPLISVLDESNSGGFPSMLNSSSEHTSSITSLLSTLSFSSSVLVSSSLDCTCKVWNVVTGKLFQTRAFPQPITAVVLDQSESLLFCGSADGRIFVNTLNLGMLEDPFDVSEDQPIVLSGHKGSITALTFCGLGLVSASEDCTACLWDVVNCVIIKRFNHLKGSITNLAVIPQSSLLPMTDHRRASDQLRVSLLEKYPQPANSYTGMITLQPSGCSHEESGFVPKYRSTDLLNQHILELESGRTPEAIQMEVEKSIANRDSAMRLTKHVMEMNKQVAITLSRYGRVSFTVPS
ncbi:hypothetical protein F0562_023290 [Nyssa sinensis]|uniref:Uncharacterized protein n=1 Tax=Nyssa sinensis TaxID=561372 RepID=A0A5J5BHQ8_9ASTE|nr:hypothetical protein F0562_023290 [Nyssa sinensis]